MSGGNGVSRVPDADQLAAVLSRLGEARAVFREVVVHEEQTDHLEASYRDAVISRRAELGRLYSRLGRALDALQRQVDPREPAPAGTVTTP